MAHLNSISVKVMRSYDYCHFEINLAADVSDIAGKDALSTVDDMRKSAARLADKAVEQYKIAKANFQKLEDTLSGLKYDAEMAKRTPEDQRTPEEKAAIKALEDFNFNSRYDYEDDWED